MGAAKHTPDDSLPSRNLSSAYYELIRYKECISRATAALTMVDAENTENKAVQIEKLKQ